MGLSARSTEIRPGTPLPTDTPTPKHHAECSCHSGLVVCRPTGKVPSTGLVVLSNGTLSIWRTDTTMPHSTRSAYNVTILPVTPISMGQSLISFLATGLNMTLGSSASASASGSAKTSDVETVPGLSGGGTGNNGQRGDNTTDSSSSSDSGSSS